MVGGIDLPAHHVARLEVHEPVGPRAHRPEIGRSLARLRAPVGLEEMLGQDHAAEAAEGVGPVRGRLLEDHLDRVTAELLHPLDVLVGADRGGRGGRVSRVLPGEDHVVGREGPAVVPGDTLLELPGDM